MTARRFARSWTIATVVLLVTAGALQADRRKYAWTYQFLTIPQRATELELYQTTRLDDRDSWEYRIEIEHGLTPRWDISIYQVFVQDEGGAFRWDAVQLRTRYKLAEPGRFPLDPLLYVEYFRKIDLKKQNKVEAKLVLGRDFDRINLAFNGIYEFFWAPGEPVHEIGLDIGMSYAFSYQFSIGMESRTRREFLDAPSGDEVSWYLGPALSFASGETWYTLGIGWGLSDDSNDAQVRLLMGIGL